jgi:hypothetical protein
MSAPTSCYWIVRLAGVVLAGVAGVVVIGRVGLDRHGFVGSGPDAQGPVSE